MSDTDPSSDGHPLISSAGAEETAPPAVTDERPVTESVGVLIRELATLFNRDSEIDLETIRERTTVRNVIDYREVDKRLDPGWAVDPEIVKFGEEPLADALVFSHYQRSYDVILKPVDIFVPTDEIELFIHDRTRGIRHRLVRTTPSLDKALDHTVTKLTHSHFNPDAPYLASLLADEQAEIDADGAAGELDGEPFDLPNE